MFTPAIRHATKAKQATVTGIAEVDKNAITSPINSAEPTYKTTQVPTKFLTVLYTRIATTVPKIAITGNNRVSKMESQPGVLYTADKMSGVQEVKPSLIKLFATAKNAKTPSNNPT